MRTGETCFFTAFCQSAKKDLLASILADNGRECVFYANRLLDFSHLGHALFMVSHPASNIFDAMCRICLILSAPNTAVLVIIQNEATSFILKCLILFASSAFAAYCSYTVLLLSDDRTVIKFVCHPVYCAMTSDSSASRNLCLGSR